MSGRILPRELHEGGGAEDWRVLFGLPDTCWLHG